MKNKKSIIRNKHIFSLKQAQTSKRSKEDRSDREDQRSLRDRKVIRVQRGRKD